MKPGFRIKYFQLSHWILASVVLPALLLPSLLLSLPVNAAEQQRYPLEPVNLSGPKATMRTFLTNAENAYKEFQKSGYRTKDALKYVKRASSTFDMQQISPTLRKEVGYESTLRLKAILDNIEVPGLDKIPGPEDFKEKDDLIWRIPHTDITIARITEGPRRGAWLFTAATVSQIDDYYDLVKNLHHEEKVSGWIYEKYIYSPGWMIPAGMINALPRWMDTSLFEQTLWQWGLLLLTLIVGVMALVGSWRPWALLVKKMASEARRWRWERMIYPIFGIALMYALLYFISEQINITGSVMTVVAIGLKTLLVIFATWLVFICGDIFIEGIVSIEQVKSAGIATDVTRLVIRVITFIIAFIILYNVADRFGIPVTAVFASAGIAGLAVALAAKDTLANLFGGVTIFMDRPFKTGDYIVLDNAERGEVVQIGLRSTRILTRDDVMISIPNAIITNTKIINQSSPEPMFRVRTNIGVAYGSDIKNVEKIMMDQAASNSLVADHPEPRVRFRQFGEYSLNFELQCWAKRPDDRSRLLHGLNSGIYNAFNEAGIKIPFPQQDVHLRNE